MVKVSDLENFQCWKILCCVWKKILFNEIVARIQLNVSVHGHSKQGQWNHQFSALTFVCRYSDLSLLANIESEASIKFLLNFPCRHSKHRLKNKTSTTDQSLLRRTWSWSLGRYQLFTKSIVPCRMICWRWWKTGVKKSWLELWSVKMWVNLMAWNTMCF